MFKKMKAGIKAITILADEKVNEKYIKRYMKEKGIGDYDPFNKDTIVKDYSEWLVEALMKEM